MTDHGRIADQGFDAEFLEIYEDLRLLAGRQLQRGQGTLQPTALVHEAYLRCRNSQGLRSLAHLRARLVTAMRHVLVDHARRRQAKKRCGGQRTLCECDDVAGGTADVLHLDEILTELQRRNERMAKIAELRVIGGLTIDEVAAELDIAASTVSMDWHFARAWIARQFELSPDRGGSRQGGGAT